MHMGSARFEPRVGLQQACYTCSVLQRSAGAAWRVSYQKMSLQPQLGPQLLVSR